MTSTPRRQRRKPGENRELLLESGLVEFGLLGYHGASTAAIARRAGVPQPHVYTSFLTKRALFLACVDRALSRLMSPVSTLQNPARSIDSVGGEDAPEGTPGLVLPRMLFQAVAAAQDGELQPELGKFLDAAALTLGEKRLFEFLTQGAVELMQGAPESP